jgi:hypothetical protein
MNSFELLRDQTIPELKTRARLFRHMATGAELLSLENDDENKVFGITFRTPPADSTGLAHIMEHAVLGGSEKYPVREPFVELMKGSMATFVNAMTGPDMTTYPVASQNVKDFYNLIDVYMDGVLHPLIPEHTFQQEGWHYELEKIGDAIVYKGIVFNEMKGSYSSPDNLLGTYSTISLFPEHPYGFDSGGDPRVIPNLSYRQFKAFHEKYYHPSNGRIFFYGDDDPEERLRRMAEYLNGYDRRLIDSEVPFVTPFSVVRRLEFPYDPGETGEGKPGKAMVTTNWVLAEGANPQTALEMGMLSHILIGTPASPLRKALIDSGLGEDLAGSGLDAYLRQQTFSTGLKGIDPDKADEVERLILTTLEKLAREGIDPDTVAASVNTIEFRLRENNTGQFPRGLSLMLRSLTSWLHGGDPIARLAFEDPLANIKERLGNGEKLFEGLIRRYFLDNKHRTTVLLRPEAGYNQRIEAEELRRLAEAQSKMKEEVLLAIVENTRQLKLRQETPDTPEALATIPALSLSDLDRKNKLLPIEEQELAGCKVLFHDLFTNGILYLDTGFNLRALPQDLLPYVSLFGRSLVEIGTEGEDFVKLSQRIGRSTGGIRPTTHISPVNKTPEGTYWLFLRGKATTANADELLAILADILLTVKLDNRERFRQMVLEEKAELEAAMVPMGHRMVNTRLRAHFNEAGWVTEKMAGIDYLFFLRELSEAIESNWAGVLEKLEAVRKIVISRRGVLVNVTLDRTNWEAIRPMTQTFLEKLPIIENPPSVWKAPEYKKFEGLTIPAQVNYVTKGGNLYSLGYDYHGSMMVINNYLRTTWLWEKVRVQGGAYGGFVMFDYLSGVLTYLSYRDPNLLKTLENYDGTADFLSKLEIDPAELTKSIIGTIGDMDTYMLPDTKGYTSMVRYLSKSTDEERQIRREQVLGTKAGDFKALGEVLKRLNERGQVVVMGSSEAIEAANRERGGWLDVKKVL